MVKEKNLEILYQSPECFRAGTQNEKTMKTAKLRFMRSMFGDFKEEMEGI